MNFWKKRLTARLASYFLLLSLVTIGIVSGVAFFRARESLKQSAFNQLSVAATLKEDEIARWFEDQQRDFLLTTQFPQVQAGFKILLTRKPSDRDYRDAKAVLRRYLTEVASVKPNLQEIYVLDRSGKVKISTNQSREGQYEVVANLTYFERVNLAESFAPIFYVSPVTGKPAVTLATPLRDETGDRLGLLSVHLNLQRIDRIVRERTGLGETGETYLVSSLVTGNAFISKPQPPAPQPPETVGSDGIDAAMRGANGQGLYRNYAGVPVIGAYRWLNERDLALIVEMSQAEAFAPARQLAATLVFVGLVAAGMLSAGVYWLSRQISRPILAIADAAIEVAAGNLETAAPKLTDDEVGVLAEKFNQMVVQLKSSRERSRRYSRSLEVKAEELEKTLLELGRTQAQLIQREKMSSLGQLVAGIAHEINNPLNFIYGNLNHAHRYTADLLNLIQLYRHYYPQPVLEVREEVEAMDLEFAIEDLPKVIASMKVGADRITKIVKSLRNFSRLDESDRKLVDIREGIDSTLVILQNRLKGKSGSPDIQLIEEYSRLPKVECYASELNQVFMHILVNAIDALRGVRGVRAASAREHRQESCVLPTITIRTQLTDWESVRIILADNGPGMSEQVRQKIFDPFFTTKPVGLGTGLGLSIAHSVIVQHHSGQLTCNSTLGRGTEFAIEIPLRLSPPTSHVQL